VIEKRNQEPDEPRPVVRVRRSKRRVDERQPERCGCENEATR
jgi:hypothetical protein